MPTHNQHDHNEHLLYYKLVSLGAPIVRKFGIRSLALKVWTKSIQIMAKIWVYLFKKPIVIGVTGSVGKTTTKDFIRDLLMVRYDVLASSGNHNNEIGFPLSVLRIRPRHQVVVLEYAAERRGDIRSLASILSPDIAVITHLGESHIGKFGSFDNLVLAKKELPDAVPKSGWVILSQDVYDLMFKQNKPSTNIMFFSGPNSRVKIELIKNNSFYGSTFKIQIDGTCRIIDSPLWGEHNLANLASAVVVAQIMGIPAMQILDFLEQYKPTVEHVRVSTYPNRLTIVDDSYNSSPSSLTAALNVLSKFPGKRVAVLGDMLELGPYAAIRHQEMGALAARCTDRLILYGEYANHISKAATENGLSADVVTICATQPDILSQTLQEVASNTCLLFKASRLHRFDELYNSLIAMINSDGEFRED